LNGSYLPAVTCRRLVGSLVVFLASEVKGSSNGRLEHMLYWWIKVVVKLFRKNLTEVEVSVWPTSASPTSKKTSASPGSEPGSGIIQILLNFSQKFDRKGEPWSRLNIPNKAYAWL
jgi:hypothetical protein